MYFGITILIMLLVAAAVDLRSREISLVLILICAVISLLKIGADCVEGVVSPSEILLSLLPGVLFLLLAFMTGQGIGFGDGLLLLAAGPSLGGHTAVIGTVTALFLSGLFSALLLALRRAGKKTRLPFVPFLTLGMGVVMIAKV